MQRKWRENEDIEWDSLHFIILSLFPPTLSISYTKIWHILSQKVRYGTFVVNVTKNLTYGLWGNNSGSNWLQGSSASFVDLLQHNTNNSNFSKTIWQFNHFRVETHKLCLFSLFSPLIVICSNWWDCTNKALLLFADPQQFPFPIQGNQKWVMKAAVSTPNIV